MADKIKVSMKNKTCNAFAYGQGGIIHVPAIVCFTEADTRKVEALLNKAIADLPVEFVDEYPEWDRLSKGT